MRDVLKNYRIFNIDPKKLRSKNFFKNMLEYRHKVMAQFKDAYKNPEEFLCLLCGGTNGNEYLSYQNYTLIECTQCSLVSPNIKFDRLADEEVYDDDAYVQDTVREIVDTYEYRKQTYAPERLSYIEEKISDLSRADMKVLDLGCGPGYFIDYLKDAGIAYKGLELAHFLVDICEQRGLNVEEAKLEQEKDASYNIITMFDVLEHLTEPVKLFQELNRVLMPGGYVLAYTPHIHSIAYHLMGGLQNTLLPFQHVGFYDERSLAYLASRTGFAVPAIDYYGLDVMDYFYMKREQDHLDYHEYLKEFIPIMQAVIDKQKLSNHIRVIFRKL
ncbi:MAG: class I SAM-dependent methyltransferase [Patescibacteria group bacterium]